MFCANPGACLRPTPARLPPPSTHTTQMVMTVLLQRCHVYGAPQVVVAPDPALFDHLITHGVAVDLGEAEGERLGRAFTAQVRAQKDSCVFPFCYSVTGVARGRAQVRVGA